MSETTFFPDKKDIPLKQNELLLPMNRIKTIMKSSPDVDTIEQEALFVVTKCTEMFIQHLAQSGFEKRQAENVLEYKQIADTAQANENLEFLSDILPQKMTVKEYKELMKLRKNNSLDESSEEETSDDDKMHVGDLQNSNLVNKDNFPA